MNEKSLTPLRDEDYEAIEAAVMETARGRWFLAEFAIRNRSADTRILLDAIQRLENTVRSDKSSGGSDGEMDKVRFELADMASVIDRTKDEIAELQGDTEEGGRFNIAANELDAIVTQTETATQDILNSAETIQELAWTFREANVDGAQCDQLEELVTGIYTACSFQDLTGQRTRKVVNVLTYLEAHIKRMINIWNEDGAAAASPRQENDPHPEAHLLNGPQLDGHGMDQSAVDDLMSFAGPVAGSQEDPVENADAAASTDVLETEAALQTADVPETEILPETANADDGPRISEAHEIDLAAGPEAGDDASWDLPEPAETPATTEAAETGNTAGQDEAVGDENSLVSEAAAAFDEILEESAAPDEETPGESIDDMFVTDDTPPVDDAAPADDAFATAAALDELGADLPDADDAPVADVFPTADDSAAQDDFAAIGEMDVFEHEDAKEEAAATVDKDAEGARNDDIALLDIQDDASVFAGFEEAVENAEAAPPVADDLDLDFDDSLPAIEEDADGPAADAFGAAGNGEATVATDLSAEEMSHADVFASLDSHERADLLNAARETSEADATNPAGDDLFTMDGVAAIDDIAFADAGDTEAAFGEIPSEDETTTAIPEDDDLPQQQAPSPDADPFGEVEALADAVTEAAGTGFAEADDADGPDMSGETADFEPDADDTGTVTPEDLAAMADMLREAAGDDNGTDPTAHLTQAERIALFR